VLIVYWDVHHGNGTQDIFWEDPSVFFISLHQFPHWPGTGRADEVGEGQGRGFTRNVPLPPGTPRDAYLKRFDESLDSVLEGFRPDFVLVSSGFDVLAGDPLGGQLLEPEDMHTLTRRLMARADESCGGRVVILLEGGYDVRRTGLGAVAVMRALAGVEADPTR
jgi:acetoin utilization deacetylase AcuC-like enzyme